MKNYQHVLRQCGAIRFGIINPEVASDFYRCLNGQVTDLCRSLPSGMQTGAMMFLMGFMHINFGEKLDYFKHYYPPSWSILYWLTSSCNKSGVLSGDEVDLLQGGQAMAMLLHSLDDNLVDGDIPVTHLSLLIRGQAWLRLNEYIGRFCAGVPGGIESARELINDYYTGITDLEVPGSLEDYCELFRKQMATWVIMPYVAARQIGGYEFATRVRSSYESFGIAWRLLDDIQDLETDMAQSERSAVYSSLDRKGRDLWDSRAGMKSDTTLNTSEIIYSIILKDAILERIAGRIVAELRNAEELSAGAGLGCLADEFHALAVPVKDWLVQ